MKKTRGIYKDFETGKESEIEVTHRSTVPPRLDLTKRQKAIYDFIEPLCVAGRPPTYRDIGTAFKLFTVVFGCLACTCAAEDRIILGCYPSWLSETMPIAAIPFKNLTHINHAFLLGNKEGDVVTEKGTVPSRELCRLAHAAGVKVILGLGGAESTSYFGPMSRQPAAMRKHIQQACRVVKEYDYDGLDLDWEFPTNAEEGRAFLFLAREIRINLDHLAKTTGKTYLLNASVPVAEYAGQWLDGQALAKVVDYFNVMTFDFTGPWVEWAGHHAALLPTSKDPHSSELCVRAGMDYWRLKKKVRKEKLLVGIPFYGRGFKSTRPYGPNTKGEATPISALPYRDIVPLIAKGWIRTLDKESRVPWLQDPAGSGVIGFDDPESVAEKTRWARKYGYAGVLFWTMDHDLLPDGTHPLLDAVAKEWPKSGK